MRHFFALCTSLSSSHNQSTITCPPFFTNSATISSLPGAFLTTQYTCLSYCHSPNSPNYTSSASILPSIASLSTGHTPSTYPSLLQPICPSFLPLTNHSAPPTSSFVSSPITQPLYHQPLPFVTHHSTPPTSPFVSSPITQPLYHQPLRLLTHHSAPISPAPSSPHPSLSPYITSPFFLVTHHSAPPTSPFISSPITQPLYHLPLRLLTHHSAPISPAPSSPHSSLSPYITSPFISSLITHPLPPLSLSPSLTNHSASPTSPPIRHSSLSPSHQPLPLLTRHSAPPTSPSSLYPALSPYVVWLSCVLALLHGGEDAVEQSMAFPLLQQWFQQQPHAPAEGGKVEGGRKGARRGAEEGRRGMGKGRVGQERRQQLWRLTTM